MHAVAIVEDGSVAQLRSSADATIGHLPQFGAETNLWSSFVEREQLFLKVNSVKADKHVDALLSAGFNLLGEVGGKLLPKALQLPPPQKKSFPSFNKT